MPCTGLGERQLGSPSASAEHADELLCVERVAAGVRRAARATLGLPTAVREERRAGAARSRTAESGESETVSALRLPPPQPGRRSSSSGRAVQTTRSGTPVAQSTRWSTKSSRPSSAQWRSSKTSTSGRCSASASKKRRHAANASRRRSPASCRGPAEPDERAEVLVHPRASTSSSTTASTAVASLAAAASASSRLEDPGLGLHHLAERPEADAFAVGQRAALAPGDELADRSSSAAQSSTEEPALADPGRADQRDQLRRALALRSARPRRGAARARRSRPTSSAPPRRRCRPRGAVRGATASQTGPARPCPWRARARPRGTRSRARRGPVRRLVDEDPVTGAADWRRERC